MLLRDKMILNDLTTPSELKHEISVRLFRAQTTAEELRDNFRNGVEMSDSWLEDTISKISEDIYLSFEMNEKLANLYSLNSVSRSFRYGVALFVLVGLMALAIWSKWT